MSEGAVLGSSVVPAPPQDVAEVLASYPAAAQETLSTVRSLIHTLASETLGVGPLTEGLRWGEPAYLTERSRSGSTIRLGWKGSSPDRCNVYFSCRTTLVERFRAQFEDQLRFEGNRAIVLTLGQAVPVEALKTCLTLALTYHRRPSGR